MGTVLNLLPRVMGNMIRARKQKDWTDNARMLLTNRYFFSIIARDPNDAAMRLIHDKLHKTSWQLCRDA